MIGWYRAMAPVFIAVFLLAATAEAQEAPILTGDADTLWVTYGPDGPHVVVLSELGDTTDFSIFYPREGDGRPHDLLLLLGDRHLLLPWAPGALPVVVEGPGSRHLIRFLERRRGFSRFGRFADALAQLYDGSDREPPLIPLLFEPIMEWAGHEAP